MGAFRLRFFDEPWVVSAATTDNHRRSTLNF